MLGIIWLGSGLAAAQTPTIEDLLKDILGGGETPSQTPIFGTQAVTTLPVNVTFGTEDAMAGHSLTITATPPDPTGTSRRANTRPLAQLSLRLDGITSAATVPLALPTDWMDDHAYLMIDAQIKDSNEGVVYQAEQLEVYRGHTQPVLRLVKVGMADTPSPVPEITRFEFVTGVIEIQDRAAIKRDSQLTVQLLENALAGGTSMMIAAEKVIPLDTAPDPLTFELQRGLIEDQAPQNLSFKAWVSDWAGRKTHVMRGGVAYQGPDIDYAIQLDSLKQGKDTKRGRNLDPTLMAQTMISGEATFDPVVGIPGEARLKVQLRRSVGAYGTNPILSEQVFLLRGMETRIPFSITTDSTNFDPLIPAPYLTVALTDNQGREYYSSGEVRASEGQNLVRLYPR
ncbi:hypothetical protein ACJ3XI_03745 [Litorimonas sp. RW-G-Af-16]|uniref:hypothetical protein n=1 Tax=Litorimonas sp. RW-G-Af-16 TaxID=3241168 RepID=UPI00390CB842